MEIRVLTWNLYHGRDGPPDPALYTRRAEWSRKTERNDSHVQVNRDLYREFSGLLAAAEWDVALLQECPPRWTRRLGRDCDAHAHRSLTGRNYLQPFTSLLAELNPDLLGSAEGGSNSILVRSRVAEITEARNYTMRRFRPERRTMAFARLSSGLCVTSLHASTTDRLAEDEVQRAAAHAIEWAAGSPLVLGGDFNVRPRAGDLFGVLEDRFGLRGATGPAAIDHLLVLGAEVTGGPTAWPDERRELPEDGLALRLSDHAPVEIRLRIT